MKAALIPRLAVVGLSVLMLANTKGINIIPRRDDSKPPAPFEVRAGEAYEHGCVLHDQAHELAAKAEAASSDRNRQRFDSKADRRYRDSISGLQGALELLSEVDQQPAWLHDLYLRLANAFLATDDLDSAHAAVESALELRPSDLATLYELARIALARSDLDAVQRTYLRLLTEAEVYGEAWNYVDRLLALMKTAVTQPALASADAQRAVQFGAWLEEQATQAAETVRWTALP